MKKMRKGSCRGGALRDCMDANMTATLKKVKLKMRKGSYRGGALRGYMDANVTATLKKVKLISSTSSPSTVRTEMRPGSSIDHTCTSTVVGLRDQMD